MKLMHQTRLHRFLHGHFPPKNSRRAFLLKSVTPKILTNQASSVCLWENMPIILIFAMFCCNQAPTHSECIFAFSITPYTLLYHTVLCSYWILLPHVPYTLSCYIYVILITVTLLYEQICFAECISHITQNIIHKSPSCDLIVCPRANVH